MIRTHLRALTSASGERQNCAYASVSHSALLCTALLCSPMRVPNLSASQCSQRGQRAAHSSCSSRALTLPSAATASCFFVLGRLSAYVRVCLSLSVSNDKLGVWLRAYTQATFAARSQFSDSRTHIPGAWPCATLSYRTHLMLLCLRAISACCSVAADAANAARERQQREQPFISGGKLETMQRLLLRRRPPCRTPLMANGRRSSAGICGIIVRRTVTACCVVAKFLFYCLAQSACCHCVHTHTHILTLSSFRCCRCRCRATHDDKS